MSIYVGIDQSYTGFALVAEDRVSEPRAWTKAFPPGKYGSNTERLIAVEDWLQDRIAELVQLFFADDDGWSICMEGYSMGSKYGRELAGELGYAVKRTLWWQGLSPHVVSPMQVKQFATGKATAKKNEMLLAVYRRWGWEAANDNEADAFTLMKISRALKEPDGLVQIQQKVVNKLLEK